MSERDQREQHFVSIYFLAGEAMRESPDRPENWEDLIRPLSSTDGGIGKPFVDGLVYRPLEATFTLEEPKAHKISLFRSDRLIATERKWPRWELSGKLARKFSGQEVPPPGYE